MRSNHHSVVSGVFPPAQWGDAAREGMFRRPLHITGLRSGQLFQPQVPKRVKQIFEIATLSKYIIVFTQSDRIIALPPFILHLLQRQHNVGERRPLNRTHLRNTR